MTEYGTIRFDGGTIRPDIGGRSYTGGGLGSYSGGGSSGKKPLDDEQLAQLLKNLNQGTQQYNIKSDGGASQSPIMRGGYYGGGSGGYRSSSGNPICCIGLIILIILGLVLNFIFHFDLWMIAVILVVLLVVIGIIAMIFN
jgi:hypothetical protein